MATTPFLPAATPRERRRRDRELKTIRVMIDMYCHNRHGRELLCIACAELATYAQRRLDRCVFGAAKPTCAHCTVHCYSAEMRERVRTVMRYAGPRMLLRHPILGIAHMIDGRRPAPELAKRAAKPAARQSRGP
jgi:YbgA-like uncharacterized protein